MLGLALLGAFVLCVAPAMELLAQDDENAPQVLTTDLAARQRIDENFKRTVTFVFVDEDQITKITIDGQEQQFAPGDTVSIKKSYDFPRGRVTTVRVVVEDQAGNVRRKRYVVAAGVPLPAAGEAEKKPEPLKISVILEGGVAVDDNPTQDLSLPIDIGEIGTIEGVVDDSEQTDNRTTLQAVVSASKGEWSGYVGLSDTAYSKAQNEALESQVLFLGGKWNPGRNNGFVMGLTYSDIAVGGSAYSTQITASPGIALTEETDEETLRKTWSVDVTSKSFDNAALEGVTQFTLKRVSNYREKATGDTSRGLVALGTNSEGSAASEFQHFNMQKDWQNRWESGFRWDYGLGLQYRNYPNDEDVLTDVLGSTRVDIPMRISTGIGWEFTPTLSAMLRYRYVFNLSSKSPYERTITGLTVRGVF